MSGLLAASILTIHPFFCCTAQVWYCSLVRDEMIYEKKIIQWKQTYKHNPTDENNSDNDQWIAAEIVSVLKR